MPATLRDIAEKTNLSLATVSHIAGAKPRMSLYREETRQRVLDAMRELNYRPNSSARSTRSGVFGCVALLQSNLPARSYLPRILLDVIHDALNKRDWHLTLARIDEESLTDETFVPKILRLWMADGLLVNYSAGLSSRTVDLIETNRVPSVYLNIKGRKDSIHPDDFLAGRELTGRLVEAGHRKIAYVDYNFGHTNIYPLHYSAADRFAGYLEQMKASGLAPNEIRGEQQIPVIHRFEACRQWLGRKDRPTAALTYSPEVAVPLACAAVSLGLRIPEDFSLVTIGENVCADPGFPIDTALLPERIIGLRAVEMLAEKINNPDRQFREISVPLTFAGGWTIAAPSRSSRSRKV